MINELDRNDLIKIKELETSFNYVLKDIILDEIYTQVATFMPQLRVNRNDINIVQDDTTLSCTIKATNMLDFTPDLYNIVLLSREDIR